MFQVAFPGLGIGQFTVNSTAFKLFGIEVQWYGVIIAIGMLCAFAYACTRAKIEGVKTDDMVDLALFMIISGVLGARLYYVIFNFKEFLTTGGSFFENVGQTLVKICSIRNGGLAIYGAIILSFFVALLFSKKKKIRFTVLLDIMAPAVILAQGIGRWGNFMNGEAFGVTTDLPWRMQLITTVGGGLETHVQEVHPTFLYESLWCILGFILLTVLYKKKKFNGQIFYMYLVWYGFERAFVEGLRTDSLYILNTGIRVSQVVSAAIFVAGIVLIVLNLVKLSKAKKLEIADTNEEVAIETTESTEESATETVEDTVDSSDNDESIQPETEEETASTDTPEISDEAENEENGTNN